MELDYKKLFDDGFMFDEPQYLSELGDISIESPIYCAGGLRFDTSLHIGAFANINHAVVLGHSKMGRYCSIGQGCLIGGDKHPSNFISTSRLFYQKGFRNFDHYEDLGSQVDISVNTGEMVTIGNDVFIGPYSIITRGVFLSDGCIVMPGSVVVSDVNPYEIVGGNPAKHIKFRFSSEDIDLILKSKWWNYKPSDILKHDATKPNVLIKRISDNSISELFLPKLILNTGNIVNYFK